MKTATAAKCGARRQLTAGDIMETHVVTVSPQASLLELERLLAEHRISGMPVTDDSGRPLGVVSFRDLLDHYADDPDTRPPRRGGYFLVPDEGADHHHGKFAVPAESEGTVADVMTPVIIDVTTEDTLLEVCRTMAKHSVHRVLVTEPSTGRMLGIISSLAVLEAMARA
jgi:CBS domain-containing protein